MDLKLTKWLNDNYNEIIKITKLLIIKNKPVNKGDYMDVAHNVIEEFIKNKKSTKLIDDGEALKYISGMIWNKLFSYNVKDNYIESKLKIVDKNIYDIEKEDEEYNDDLDLIIKIENILNEKEDDIKIWYNLTILKMWINEKNYSSISRITNIPRKSVRNAVMTGKEYVIKKLKLQK